MFFNKISFHFLSKRVFSGLKYPASKAIFEKTNEIIEKMSKLFLLAASKLFLNFAVLFLCGLSFITYFITGWERDSLVLPVPMW